MKTLKQILSEGVGSYQVKRTAVHKNPDNISDKEQWDNDGADGSFSEYHIHKDGKKVGELTQDHYYGYIRGHLHGKALPEISNYSSGSGAQGALHSFLKSKTGKKWSTSGVLNPNKKVK